VQTQTDEHLIKIITFEKKRVSRKPIRVGIKINIKQNEKTI
jgi:hypothetical protein